jgi:effector-binding domain-containing protein
MKKRYIMIIILSIIAGGLALWGPIVSQVEQASYQVIESHEMIEIRQYDPLLIAETEVIGDRKTSINQGFRIIADYIFGNNTDHNKIAMTAPVLQESGQKIAMTAPVIQEGTEDHWFVRFVMPHKYTMETLPKPNNPEVKIREIPSKRVAVIRFSGIATETLLKYKEDELRDFLEKESKNSGGLALYAFYNPPWTLPFFRRNEVMIEIDPS